MSKEQGVTDDGDSFESKFRRLVEYQTQNQHQLDTLTANLANLIQALGQNPNFVNSVGNDTQNLVVVPSLPQADDCNQGKETHPRASEQELTCEEIHEAVVSHVEVLTADSPTVELNS
ncbi:hypothetical protein MKW94_009916, partial [Papaver nudicaule]|nr:hypothetical protein [Papaver nudicaule]